ncbi:chemotaxis response regulator protein-glutamate methylesterase [Planctomyces sp. SH-PL62]|uniref:chemotaxis response regulator protein-glutamate methylesterase n=1 Tax=Planctomyces sp. SH-PL62 TaxID=1636152 RepID=UPI00078C9339|nr:chemotaxis response regulator protein-glutamate methylesterase [Planctomyces sp. SH-PL62]AMV37864.1 Chemotaxis response regulator protein-glutamate methylesterase of group 2 operon [Planctomyces sp. SH-PL62]
MRIGIVNDSVMAREALRRVVASADGLQVAWTARDGAEGVRMVRADRPDLVLMDLFMPEMDGVESTRRIMKETPCPILVVTATVSGQIDKVYQAMGFGALDAVDTPVLKPCGACSGGGDLLRKIETIGKLIGKYQPCRESWAPPARPPASLGGAPLLVVGASTGGPFAVAEILKGLPRGWDVATVIVQHVDAFFVAGLAGWLSEHSDRRVVLAREGDLPTPGQTFLAATDDHLVLSGDGRLRYSAEPRSACYRPSVDVFFQSVARHWPGPGAAALLTGMGRDGAEGLLALHRRGWLTIAQDEATSVVWGMPRAAVERGAAELVLPLGRIADAIARGFLAADPTGAQTQAPRR